jgi:hypothetical protein
MRNEELKPLPKRIHNIALRNGVSSIFLNLESHSKEDKGRLKVKLGAMVTYPMSSYDNEILDYLIKAITEWYWNNHESFKEGGGDVDDLPIGVEIEINLKENKVNFADWEYIYKSKTHSSTDLKIDETEVKIS